MTVLPFKSPQNSQKYPPLFNIPPLTLYALACIVIIHLVFTFAPLAFVQIWGYRLAFVPARYTLGDFGIWAIVSPFTHLFLHGGWLHVAMNGLMLMAFGAASERMLGAQRTAVLFILAGLAGALTQFAINPSSPIPMIGASGALSGLFAAVLLRLQASGQMAAGKFGIWGVAVIWIGLSLLTAFIGGSIGIGDVAWAAHAGGFIAGILLMKLKYFRSSSF